MNNDHPATAETRSPDRPQRRTLRAAVSGLVGFCLVVAVGCGTSASKPPEQPPAAPAPGPVFGRTTQNIGEFDPNARQEVSDSKVKVNQADPTSIVTAPLQAYRPMVEQSAKIAITHALSLFNATEGRYPTSYEEFMEKIIKANNIRLPVLPEGYIYKYDVENHELVVVRPEGAAPVPAE